MKPGQPPKYRLHKPSGQAVVTIAGKDHYLGPHGSDASHAAYRRKIADWGAAVPSSPTTTVLQLVTAYRAHADGYYRKLGHPTSQISQVRAAAKGLLLIVGGVAAGEVRPIDLGHVRDAWVADGLCRKTVNSYLSTAREIFRWGVERGMVAPSTWHGLLAVKGVRRGRGAIDRPGVEPVDAGAVAAVLGRATAEVAAMIRAQLLTGMRPGEVATIRPGEIDRSGPIWVYRPTTHKTEHADRDRVIPIGPKCRAILGPWLDRAGDGLAFPPSPWRAARKIKHFHTEHRILAESYRQAIRKACDEASIPVWSPNRLRHNAATEIRRLHGLEAASEILGHSKPDTTLIYALRDLEAMKRTAEAFG